jgi:hypothetical protein
MIIYVFLQAGARETSKLQCNQTGCDISKQENLLCHKLILACQSSMLTSGYTFGSTVVSYGVDGLTYKK